MASSVFYRFKSQKEPSRISFDGTGISVFELKRAIIETSSLGDGTDFELTLTSSDGSEVYDDDTEIIPRSTVVIAKRQPAARPGRGGAARYVSGKPPNSARTTQRTDNQTSRVEQKKGISPSTVASAISELQSEKQREEAVLKLGADMWKHQQKEMAAAAPIRTSFRPKTTGSDNSPPDWYTCNRCGIKGHWIKDCPQNGNPEYDDNRRIKKSIGIPRSRLEVIDKKTILGSDGNFDSSKLPAGAMIDGDGNYVIVKPDKATWNKYQEKASKSAAAQEDEVRGSKELQEKGLECPIDKRLFVDPTKTPCCQTTYCNECITNALLDEDLRCPACGKDGVLIDDLRPDGQMASDIRKYTENRATQGQQRSHKETKDTTAPTEPSHIKSERHRSPTPTTTIQKNDTYFRVTSPSSRKGSPSGSPQETLSRKRKAESNLENSRKSPRHSSASATADASAAEKDQSKSKLAEREPPRGPRALMDAANTNQILPFNANFGLPAGNPGSIGSMMGVTPMIWDPVSMFGGLGAMNSMSAPQLQQGMMSNVVRGQDFQERSFTGNGRGNQQNSRGGGGHGFRTFNASRPNPEESAYFRAPVNPHRHQHRRNIPRPTDYREI